MKCAKSVNVKKRTSRVPRHGLSGCRPASSATIRGEADPTWCTWQLGLGQASHQGAEVGSGSGGVGGHGRQCAGCRAAAALPPARDAETGWQARSGPVARGHDATRPVAPPDRAPRAPPADRGRPRRGAHLAQPPGGHPLAAAHPRGPWPIARRGDVVPMTRSTTRWSPSRTARSGTLSLEVATAWGRARTRRPGSEGCSATPGPRPPRERVRHGDGGRRRWTRAGALGLHRVTAGCFADNACVAGREGRCDASSRHPDSCARRAGLARRPRRAGRRARLTLAADPRAAASGLRPHAGGARG